MQGNDRPNHTSQIDDERLIISLDISSLDEIGHAYLGQQIEYILKMVDDLMVNWQLAFDDLVHVGLDVVQTRVEAFEAVELVRQLLAQTSHGYVSDIA